MSREIPLSFPSQITTNASVAESTLARQQERKQERLRGAGAREITRKRSGFDLAPVTAAAPQPAPPLIQIPPLVNTTVPAPNEGRRRSARISTGSATPDVEDSSQGSTTKRRRLEVSIGAGSPAIVPASSLDAEQLVLSQTAFSISTPGSPPRSSGTTTRSTRRVTRSPDVTQVETVKSTQTDEGSRRSAAVANQTPETRGKRTRQPSPDKFLTPSVLRNKIRSAKSLEADVNTPEPLFTPLRARKTGFELLSQDDSPNGEAKQSTVDENTPEVLSSSQRRSKAAPTLEELETSNPRELDEIYNVTYDSVEGGEGFVEIPVIDTTNDTVDDTLDDTVDDTLVYNPVIHTIRTNSRRRSSRLQSPMSAINDRVGDISLREDDVVQQEQDSILEDEPGNDTSMLGDSHNLINDEDDENSEPGWEGEPSDEEADQPATDPRKVQRVSTASDTQPSRPKITKKTKQPRKSRNNDDYIPITVHRLKETGSFKHKYAPGVTAVDIVAQLIRDKILRAVNVIEKRCSADVSNDERKLAKRQKNALILFDEDVGGRFTRHAELLDSFHSLRNELRTAEREKVSLRNQLLEMRKDHESQARQMDDVRKGHELKADDFSKILNTNNTLLELVTFADTERLRHQQQQQSSDDVSFSGLQGILKLVADDMCSNNINGNGGVQEDDDDLDVERKNVVEAGMLKRVREFNAYLEKANKVLEGL